MTTKSEKFPCTEPGCSKVYNDNAHLGIHKRAAHGIVGTSHNAKKSREERKNAKAAAAQPKRKYTKRSTSLATIHQETNGQIEHASNGHNPAASPRSRLSFEAALAVGFGRFQELRKAVAIEYDLPPRSYAARLRELINAEALW